MNIRLTPEENNRVVLDKIKTYRLTYRSLELDYTIAKVLKPSELDKIEAEMKQILGAIDILEAELSKDLTNHSE